MHTAATLDLFPEMTHFTDVLIYIVHVSYFRFYNRFTFFS